MNTPPKLTPGDTVRIIAPSSSLAMIGQETRLLANQRFEEMGLVLSFGKHVEEMDDFASSSILSRVEDLHEAFADDEVKAIITVLGGYNCNQLLRYIDWDLIKSHPKIFCGYSDITALNNAILAKTGLVTYSGPHYSTFGQKLYFDYTLEYFEKCLLCDHPFDLVPSEAWSDDPWYRDQDHRNPIPNPGYRVINEGEAEGILLGANLCTINLLQGTEYMPALPGSVLFLEDDEESKAANFDRDLQSLIHQPGFEDVRGIAIGRFQRASQITDNLLEQIIQSKRELDRIPVVANVDFGHTDPKITFPIGGRVRMAAASSAKLTILDH